MNRKTVLAIAASLALVLSGCASLPRSGEPQPFTIEAPTREPLYQTGQGPRAGSKPDQLVLDFLRACQAGTNDDYQTARQYLMPAAAASWRPDDGVLIYGSDQPPAAEAQPKGDVTLNVHAKGSLSADGEFTLADGSETAVSFELVKNAQGEWRIASLDDGVLLSQPSFASTYQQIQLYFLAPSQDSLVPDPRWFPRKRLPSYVMSALIKGPSDGLQDAVYTALNPSMVLPTQGVEIGEDQIIRVSLVGNLPDGDIVREHLAWQVTSTLDQVPSSGGVVITVNDVPLPPVEPPFGPPMLLDRAVGVSDGEIVYGDGENWSSSGIEIGEHGRSPAVGPVDESVMAWIGGDDTVVIRRGETLSEVSLNSPLPPVIDRWGWVWSGEHGANSILALGPDGEEVRLSTSTAENRKIHDIAIAPDGVRIASVMGSSGSVEVRTIVRSPDGSPIELGSITPFVYPEPALSVTWVGTTGLASLNADGEERNVVLLGLATFPQTFPAPAGTASVTSAGTQARIYVQDGDAMLYARAGALWRSLGDSVGDVRFAG